MESNQSLKESGKLIKITKSMETRNNEMVRFEVCVDIFYKIVTEKFYFMNHPVKNLKTI